MAACVGEIDIQTVQAAMEQVKTVDVKAWGEEQLGTTLLAKRRKVFGSWRKNQHTKVGQNPTGELLEEAMGF